MRHDPATDHPATADALFPQICRATPQEARGISMLLTASERAVLALFCNARAHLREQGRAIASVCSRDSLVKEGGQAGLVLFGQIEAGVDTWGAAAHPVKRRVSLAG